MCYSWRKFIAIVTAVFVVLGIVLAFILPKEYEGRASVLPSQKSGLLAGLGVGSTVSSLAKQFAPLVGGTEGQIGTGFNYLAILNSRDAMERVVRKFDLLKVYSISDSSVDKAIARLRENSDFEIDKYSEVVVKVYDRSPVRAAAMANYFVDILNGINGNLSSEDARNLRIVIENRYLKNVSDLEVAEDSMKIFQQRYGVFSLPEQAKASVAAGAELESQMILAQVKLSVLEKQLGAASPEIQTLNQQIEALRQKINDLRSGKDMLGGDNSGVLLPFKEVPGRAMEYLDLYRDIEIQSKLLEIVYPLYEQAKLEEAKETPTVLVLDRAVPPEKKTRPLRALIILSSLVLGVALSIFFVTFVNAGLTQPNVEGTIRDKYQKLAAGVRRHFGPRQ
ncbi:MAG: Wzz/FepE/Etk N-terminal domain-containing protein [Bacteroidetes bacterium]|nr:Wzz/FepE/Etk N-terminal domain-containing protein [Bacteroidota bacterium]